MWVRGVRAGGDMDDPWRRRYRLCREASWKGRLLTGLLIVQIVGDQGQRGSSL